MDARAKPVWPPTPCNAGVCKISVSVDATVSPCQASVNKPYVSIEKPKNIQWTIATRGYSFAPNGIVFDDTAQFEPRPAGGSRKFIVHDKYTQGGDFKYTVNVQDCAPLDPYVRN
jgi:hypothetical protein